MRKSEDIYIYSHLLLWRKHDTVVLISEYISRNKSWESFILSFGSLLFHCCICFHISCIATAKLASVAAPAASAVTTAVSAAPYQLLPQRHSPGARRHVVACSVFHLRTRNTHDTHKGSRDRHTQTKLWTRTKPWETHSNTHMKAQTTGSRGRLGCSTHEWKDSNLQVEPSNAIGVAQNVSFIILYHW